MSLSNLGLDAFQTTAESGTILLAAKKLGLAPTAVTQRIKQLEADLGAPVFTRSRTGMTLTGEGKTLLEYCVKRTREELRARNSIAGLAVTEPLRMRVAGATFPLERRFFPLLAPLKKEFPEVYFEFTADDSADLVRRLRERQADFVLLDETPPPATRYKRLAPAERILVGPYAWRDRELRDILREESIVDFDGRDPYTDRFLEKFGLLPKVTKERHFLNNTIQMIGWVERGLGFAVFESEAVRAKIAAKKLVTLAPKNRLVTETFLAWNDFGEQMNPAMARLIEQVQ